MGPNGSMDEAIENFRRELGNLATELIGAYNSLYFLEKFWLKLKGINVGEAKSALLTLSVTLGVWKAGESKAEKEIEKVYKYLRFEKIK